MTLVYSDQLLTLMFSYWLHVGLLTLEQHLAYSYYAQQYIGQMFVGLCLLFVCFV